jgi:Polyketide cyclase / dehydrase and lipid transport
MVRKVLIGIAAVVVLFIIVVVTRPSTFHIERSVSMAAPPANAFGQVNDFHAWSGWSPWEKLDPQMKKTFDGSPSGVGAIYSWVGNDKVGEGKMTIEKSAAPSLVGIKLQFFKPFAATNQSTFTFAPAGDGTKVTWAMDGENNFVGKAFSMFMDMDKMVGGDFERGLASMKTLAESAPKPSPEAAKAGP